MSDPSLEHPSDAPRDPRDVAAEAGQPLRDGDSSVEADPSDDPAQAEWEATTAADAGEEPASAPLAETEVPPIDAHPPREFVPDSQGQDADVIGIGEDGEGDLSPEDL